MESNRSYLLEEKPLSLLMKLGIPAVIMSLADELNSFIDAVFIGQYFGSEAVSSMSIILPIMLLIVSIGSFISEGMSIAVSRFLGAKNIEEANRYTINSLALTLVISGVCGGLFYLSLPKLLAQFNLIESVKLYSLLYLRILCLGMPIFMLTLLLGRMVYLEGKIALLLSTAILQLGSNILINYVLIGLLNFGVEGAAVGTLIAECIQIGILYKYIQSEKMTIKLDVQNIKFDKHFLKEISLLGAPSFVSMVLLSLTLGIESKIIADFGTNALSVQTITGYMFSITSSIAQGIMGVGLILMSYAAGAGDERRYFKVLKILIRTVFGVVIVFNGMLVMNRSLLVTIFTDAKQVIQLTELPALIYGTTAPFIFSTNVFLYAMQPIGMEKLSTFIFMIQQIVLFVPLLWLLKYYGFFMAIAAQPISEVIGGMMTLMLCPLFLQKAKKYFVTFKD